MWCLISILLSRQDLQTVRIVLQHNAKALLQRVQDFLPYLMGAQGHGISEQLPARKLPCQAPLSFLPLCKTMLGAPGDWPKVVKGAPAKQGPAHLTSCTAVSKMPCSDLPALSSAPCREYPAPPLSFPPDHDTGQGTWHWLCESRGSEEAEPSHLG